MWFICRNRNCEPATIGNWNNAGRAAAQGCCRLTVYMQILMQVTMHQVHLFSICRLVAHTGAFNQLGRLYGKAVSARHDAGGSSE